MKLTVFQSDKGDCLLLTGAEGHTVLIDGGMKDSYKKYVRPALGLMKEQQKDLDLVYVSHIDQDHIAGVLQMLNDEVAWRVYDYHKNSPQGNSNWKAPGFKRPPKVKAIWHNAFHDQVSANRGMIEEMLAASAGFMHADREKKFKGLAEQYTGLVTSIREAILLSNRINAKQLDIPLNPHFGGKLAMVRDDQHSLSLGGMKIYVVGPFKKDLKKLRSDWNKWLKKSQDSIRKLRRKAREDEELLSLSDLEGLAQIGLEAAGGIGDRDKVTAPNLASLMLLVEEAGKSVLLTGDGHADDILKGLRHCGKLNAHGGIHVDVLKVQHHGSEHNADEAFAKLVTADHYVFCGNGEHGNPDPRVIDVFVNSRIGAAPHLSRNPEVDRPFKFWFNSTSTMEGADADHMKRLEDLMKTHKNNGHGRLSYKFFDSAKAEIEI